MTLNNIYETALYLGEKTDDQTGCADGEYRRQHKMRAFEIIRQGIIRAAALENIPMIHPELLEGESEVELPLYLTKVVIPTYTAAMLCQQDGEDEKYNILICEYQNAVEAIKHDEEKADIYDIIEGMV